MNVGRIWWEEIEEIYPGVSRYYIDWVYVYDACANDVEDDCEFKDARANDFIDVGDWSDEEE